MQRSPLSSGEEDEADADFIEHKIPRPLHFGATNPHVFVKIRRDRLAFVGHIHGRFVDRLHPAWGECPDAFRHGDVCRPDQYGLRVVQEEFLGKIVPKVEDLSAVQRRLSFSMRRRQASLVQFAHRIQSVAEVNEAGFRARLALLRGLAAKNAYFRGSMARECAVLQGVSLQKGL